ncbi:TIGR03089 family protein [Kutzneria sp. CA-103260]|uniref:TIGR03089 family protein n=1 Tax=Kutzneria sp. CA-103260 TaxID=2802641 RepID=UPI001BAC9B57|nr:TIGR03089 family protein [Kutzneria sp. CA-103260]QUQ70918.1 TIGR03089 family protein [Kutzneria sp. CA-103260]
MSVTARLFAPLLSAPATPLITHYDDVLGSRIELSRATVANWAAKTANWLRDELDVEVGSPVSVALPSHWQTVGVLLGAWWCGAHVVADPAGATVAFIGPDGSAPGAESVAVVALDPLGRGLSGEAPDGGLDYLVESRIFGDDFIAYDQVPGDAPAFHGFTVDDLISLAATRASALNIGAGDRVLSTLDWSTSDGLTDGLLSVLSAGASLVQCSNVDVAALPKRRESERTTVELLRP